LHEPGGAGGEGDAALEIGLRARQSRLAVRAPRACVLVVLIPRTTSRNHVSSGLLAVGVPVIENRRRVVAVSVVVERELGRNVVDRPQREDRLLVVAALRLVRVPP